MKGVVAGNTLAYNEEAVRAAFEKGEGVAMLHLEELPILGQRGA